MSQKRMIFQMTAAVLLAGAALFLFANSVHAVFTESGGITYSMGIALFCLILAFSLVRGVAYGRGWVKDGSGRDGGAGDWVSGGGGGGGGVSCGGGCGGGSGGGG